MATSFNSFNNPEQIAGYQQTQPGSTPQVSTPKPQNLLSYAAPQGSDEDDEDENFLSHLQRTQSTSTDIKQPPQVSTSTPTASGVTSPVSSNGRLTTAPAQITAPPLQAANPAPSANQGDPFAAMGGGVQLPGGQWVPRNHPLAAQGQPAPAGPATGAAPGAPPAPYAGYQPAPTRPANTAYQGTNINVGLPQGTSATQFQQWDGYNEGEQGALQRQLIEQVLRNPHTMNDQVVAQLKERQKESADSIRNQTQGAATSRAAARGVLGGGTNEAQNGRIASDFGEHLLGAYRDIDIARVGQDRADELGALQASDTLLNSGFGRAADSYRNTLAGQSAQEQANQYQGDFGLRRAGLDFDVQNANAGDRRAVAASGLDNYRTDLDAWDSNQNRIYTAGNDAANRGLDSRRIDVQQQLGQGGLDLDARRLTETGRQFDASNRLDFLNYLQRGSQFDDATALDWERLNSQNQTNWLGML
jgi:hypothetical protein